MRSFLVNPLAKIPIICIIMLLVLHTLFDVDINFTNSYQFGENLTETSLNDDIYLVYNRKCQIPNVNAFDASIMKFFKPHGYISCTKQHLLTYTTKSDNIATLRLNKTVLSTYSEKNITCCYTNITRDESKTRPDDVISVSNCMKFADGVRMYHDFVLVKCDDGNDTVYQNTHVAITLNKDIQRKLEQTKGYETKPFSVLFVGIDSISRLNFIRSLPKSHQHLVDNLWIELQGYNKIADNTFPNLMAILTGFNETDANTVCDPWKIGKLDSCPMIWYDYKALNYVTGFAEDECWMNTFNYKKKGFQNPPTDYYFRPYMLGSEKLPKRNINGMNYCTGPEPAGERILNIAKDFAVTFKDHPSFGLFWTNTFSHNELNAPSGMDTKVLRFLQDLDASGVLDDSFVIFFSDHGIRFGEIRHTSVGWLEERLPFFYVWVPNRFKREFPKEADNLRLKRNQLTTPYDIHVTLQHILVLSGFNYSTKPSSGCPMCKSLFLESEERSCEDAGIEEHWCTCNAYIPTDHNSTVVEITAKILLEKVLEIVDARSNDSKCETYDLEKIIASSVSYQQNETLVLLVIETKPKAVFEATLHHRNDSSIELAGEISRIDGYASHSKCTNDTFLKKYCYCKK